MKREHRILIISGLTIIYMIIAFAWWSVLLHRKNQEIFDLKTELVSFKDLGDIENTSIKERYDSQTKMIWGESAVFMMTLILSSWLLYRAFKKELEISRNQKNFLLSVTHELKSPIASLLLGIDTMRKRQLETEIQQRLLDNAKEDSKRLERLVQNILFSTKLEGAYEVNFENLDLTALISKVALRINQQNNNEPVILTPTEQRINLNCDQELMISLIENLVFNAIKYTSNDTAKININLEKSEKYLTMTIADQGIGIEESEKAKVFQKFYRIGNEETRKSTGTGLGLYIVKQIVNAHYGTISIHDNQPKGSIFTIKLPLNN